MSKGSRFLDRCGRLHTDYFLDVDKINMPIFGRILCPNLGLFYAQKWAYFSRKTHEKTPQAAPKIDRHKHRRTAVATANLPAKRYNLG
jgi:hypothetical protein